MKASKRIWFFKLCTTIWLLESHSFPGLCLEQVAFFTQFIITLFPNWLIEPLMPFLDVTGTNVCLNKAEYLEVGYFSLEKCHVYAECNTFTPNFLFQPAEICHVVTCCTFPYSTSRLSGRYITSIRCVKPSAIEIQNALSAT